MDKLCVQAFTLSGTPLKNLWAQSHVFEGKAGREERLFACISLEGSEDFDARLTGRKILSAFEEGFYQGTDGVYKSLLGSLNSVVSLLPTYVEDSDKLFFDLTVAVSYKDVLYLGVVGSGGARLMRERVLTDLFKKERTRREPAVASGFIKLKDIFLLYTSSFLLDITKEEMEENLNGFAAGEVSDRLAPYLMKGEKTATKAAVVLGVVPAFAESFGEAKEEPEIEKKSDLKEAVVSKIMDFKNRAEPKIFLKREGMEGSRRTSLTIAGLLLLMLFGSIFWGVRKQSEDSFKKKFVPLYQDAKDKYDEGVSLLELNPGLSKVPLNEAKAKAEELLKLVGERQEKKQVLDMMTKIDEAMAGSMKTYKVSEPALFYDLTILGDKAEGAGWSVFDKRALVYDEKNGAAYNVGLTGKSGGIVAGGDDLKGVSLFAMGDKKAYFLGEKGVMEVSIGEKGVNLVIKKDEGWGEIGGLAAYGANLYLLDKSNGRVWKYTGEYQSKSNYFATDVKPDLSKAVKMLINGSVWILNSDGELLRFTTGRLDLINLSGLSENLGEISSFYVDGDTKYLYILDKVKKRIVLFDKDSGIYNSQYQWEGLGGVSGIAADEEGKKIFLLNGAKIYSIDLK